MLKQQSGVSLLEILIALLLLAIAVLGFSAMQMRAVKATDETLYRSDALVAIRNISEDLRLYPTQAQRDLYVAELKKEVPNQFGGKRCGSGASCNEREQVVYNAWLAASLAKGNGISLGSAVCSNATTATSLKKMCIIAAWGDTTATQGNDATDCISSAGVYNKGVTCFVVETY